MDYHFYIILALAIGIAIGYGAGYLVHWIMKNTIPKGYIAKTTYDLLESKFNENDNELKERRNDIISKNEQIIRLQEKENSLNEKIANFNKEVEQRDKIVKTQFENLANQIFKEKSTDFIGENKRSLDILLDPLKKDITDFKKTIDDSQKENIRDITSLKSHIEHIQTTSAQLSEGTIKLTNALNADVKVQGNWGEDRLKLILEMEGLQKHVDYLTQSVIRDDDAKSKRPDYIIKLPQNRSIIVDSKVTLASYSDYVNAANPEEKKNHLKRMVESIKNHILLLSSKEYHNLPGLATLDFVIMFIPIEPALTIAVYDSPDIYKLASDKNVVLLTPTTLIPIAKVIKRLWDNENRILNIENIFKKVGALYDKFNGFLVDMKAIDSNLNNTQKAYNNAMNKLTESVKKGDTVIGRFQELTTMGVNVKNQIDGQMLQAIELRESTLEITALNENKITLIDEAQIITEETDVQNIKIEEPKPNSVTQKP